MKPSMTLRKYRGWELGSGVCLEAPDYWYSPSPSHSFSPLVHSRGEFFLLRPRIHCSAPSAAGSLCYCFTEAYDSSGFLVERFKRERLEVTDDSKGVFVRDPSENLALNTVGRSKG